MPFRIVVVLLGAVGTAIAAAAYPFFGLLTLLFLTFGRPQDDRPNIAPLHIPMMIVLAIVVGTFFRAASTFPTMLAGAKRLKLMIFLFALMFVSALNTWTEASSNRLY